MTTNRKKIIVLGGGYAGIMAAVRLAGKTKRLDAAVTLVNGLDHFVERPRLHEQATGTPLPKRPIVDMLRGTGAEFLQGWVTAIEPEQQVVLVQTEAGQQRLGYDKLVYALGSRVERHSVPGVAEHAFTLDPYGQSTTGALAQRLAACGDRPFQAVVVGGGATGLEAATQIKARYPRSRVSLVTQGQAGAFKGAHVQRHIKEALHEQEITIYEHRQVSRVVASGVQCGSAQIPADLIIWAGGFTASPLAEAAGLRVNARRQILVDPYLRSLSHPTIYAVGDSACPVEEPGAPWRMALFTALVSGAQAADNIVAQLKGASPRPLSYAWYGQGIALGLEDAVGFAAYPNDAAWRFVLRRKLAVRVRNFFVWYLGAALELERRFPGFFFWNGKKRYQRQRRQRQQSEPLSQV